jgi:hypothetical protein
MYLSSILFYLTWPLLIIVSYYLIRYALRQYEKTERKQAD